MSSPHSTKFRQAAFVYLHVALLYEAAVYAMLGRGVLPTRFGPAWMWLVLGAVVAGGVFVGLFRWQNVWFARGVWAIHALRLPALIKGAVFAGADARMPPGVYIMAIVVGMINLWMLARAGWDL
ncbi:MAG: hypothetical protein ACR2G6_08175 [Gemmatimonadaceae bacterium]